MFSLSNENKSLLGDMWFVIPHRLQSTVIPYLESKLGEVENSLTRQYYRDEVLGREAIHACENDYSNEIVMYMTGQGYFRIYSLCGEWRVGTAAPGGIRNDNKRFVKRAFLEELERFSEIVL